VIKKLSKYTIIAFLCLLGIFLALVGIVVIRLNMAPISLSHLLPYVEKQLVFYKYAVEMDDLVMSYDGRLVISGRDVRVVNKDSQHSILNLEKATFRFSNSNLLRAKFVPREVMASGLKVAAELTESELRVGEDYAFALGNGQEDIQVNVPIVAVLEDMHKHVSLSGWQKFEVENAQLQLKDSRKNVSWAFSDVAIFLDSDFQNISAKLTGIVKRSGVTEQVPLSLSLRHDWGDKNLHVKSEFSELSGAVVKAYVPQHLTDMVKSRVSGQIETEWNDITLFDGLKVSLQAPETAVKIPRVFSDPLEFSSVDLDGEISVNRFGRLSLSHLKAVDLDGTVFTASGEVSKFLSNEPQLDIELRVSDTSLAKVLEYIPNTVSANAVKWINEHLNLDAKVKDFLLTFKPAAPMPFCGTDCGLEIQLDYENLKVSDIKSLPPAQNLAGRFLLGQNEIRVTSKNGNVGQQKANQVKVTLDELFSTEESFVYIEATAKGPAAEVVRHVKALVPDSKIPPLEGEHVSLINLKLSTKKERADDITYNVSTTLTHLKMELPEGEGPLKADLAVFNGKNGYSYFKADEAFLKDMPVSLVWSLEKEGENALQNIELSGLQTPEMILKDIPESLVSINEKIPFTLKVMQKNEEPQKIWIESSLDKNFMDVKLFNWKKERGAPLFLKAEGILTKGKSVSLSKLELKGESVNVKGSVTKNLAKLESLPIFESATFKVGNSNDLNEFSFDGKKLKIKGRSLDIQNLFIKNEKENESPLSEIADFSADVHVDDLFLAGGVPWSFTRGTVSKKGRFWDTADITAQVEGTPVTIKLMDSPEPEKAFEKKVEVRSSRAGQFLRSVGAYEHMRGGTLIWDAFFSKDMKRGRGDISMGNVRIVKAPLLVKLISFLSLEELLSSQSGIKFEDVDGNYTINDGFIDIHQVRMSGPSIGLRAVASAHLEEQAISVRGQMIPAEGLNQVVSKIPLIGTILTGSQEGLSVANFSILGSFKDPSVSVNPLSLITPGLLKDFFSGIMGDDSGSVDGARGDLREFIHKRRQKQKKT
jgi:hypothetical protein